MRGVFDVKLLDACGYTDEDFDRAKKAGLIIPMLDSLPVVQQCIGVNNRLFDNVAGVLLAELFSCPAKGSVYDDHTSASAILAHICITNDSSDTTDYQEDWTLADSSSYDTIHERPGSVNTSNAGKRFEEDQITQWVVWTDTQGQNAIHFRNSSPLA